MLLAFAVQERVSDIYFLFATLFTTTLLQFNVHRRAHSGPIQQSTVHTLPFSAGLAANTFKRVLRRGRRNRSSHTTLLSLSPHPAA